MTYMPTILAVLAAAAMTLAGTPAKHDGCKENCLIEIKGLQPTYSAGHPVNLVIRNRSTRNIDVNVALEGLEGNSWLEVSGSVSDPKHALAKTLELSPIATGTSLTVTFDLCNTPILVKAGDALLLSDHPCTNSVVGAAMPSTFRLRVDVHVKGRARMAQYLRSTVFRLVTTTNPT